MASGIVAVGVASSQLAAPDGRRGSILLQNLSANDIYLSFGRPAVAGQCLHLPPSMPAPIILDAEVFSSDLQEAIFGIASAAGSDLYFILQSIP